MGLTQDLVQATPIGIGVALVSVLTIFTDLSLGSALYKRRERRRARAWVLAAPPSTAACSPSEPRSSSPRRARLLAVQARQRRT